MSYNLQILLSQDGFLPQAVLPHFDKIILAFGQKHNLEWLEKDGIKTQWNNILVDNYKTTLPNVFACGDAIYGAKNIGEATLSGINCAKVILCEIK